MNVVNTPILYFPIAHNTLCLPPKFCMNYCFGNMQFSQENLKTIVYAKCGGQTKCIMGNWKIENAHFWNKDLTFPDNKSHKSAWRKTSLRTS